MRFALRSANEELDEPPLPVDPRRFGKPWWKAREEAAFRWGNGQAKRADGKDPRERPLSQYEERR
jgi:hypothetical protein